MYQLYHNAGDVVNRINGCRYEFEMKVFLKWIMAKLLKPAHLYLLNKLTAYLCGVIIRLGEHLCTVHMYIGERRHTNA